ncbi:hypothetical protein C9374_000857 [Naegleria lovaniensis]|uniref:Peptidase S1 domain-containing protein n=1 Tax=Naegleria lovaniensis TaxID=51637 RepID=A0AA88GVX0_NAELO|nr:uncharacterized protein C9374_000857 [Naegleria lovaniensis]KAG2388007.1 hypothetical protein C9374_000857 [Naegleria lovaniensis]
MNHPQYNEQLVVNDIALYELSTPIVNLPQTHIAKIPRKNPLVKTPHYIVGWGITSDASGAASNEQRAGVAPIVDDALCNKLGLGMSSANGQLCAGNGDGVDACVGDSGGGLSFKPKNDTQFVVSGVVSYGPSGCGIPSSVTNRGVYSSVAYFKNWIETQVNGASPLFYYDGTGGSDQTDTTVGGGKNQINGAGTNSLKSIHFLSLTFLVLFFFCMI